MQRIAIKELEAQRVDQAFVLIQHVLPHLDLKEWRTFAKKFIVRKKSQDSGILVAEHENQFFCGMAAYRIQPDLIHGKVIQTHHLLAFDLLDRKLIAGYLAAALEEIARQNECGAVHTLLSAENGKGGSANAWLNDVLLQRGHYVEGNALCYPL